MVVKMGSLVCNRSRRRRRSVEVVVWVVLVSIGMVLIMESSEAARIKMSQQEQVFKLKPKSSDQTVTGHFLDYLPKGIPIPYSGPSRKHNDIGLQSWSSSSP